MLRNKESGWRRPDCRAHRLHLSPHRPPRAHVHVVSPMALQTQTDSAGHNMDEVIPGLWIGSLLAATDAAALRAHNIHSVLSAMRGKLSIHETFTHFQIQLDDTTDADALAFFPQCISFVEHELAQERGVLVHCQAGMSRSATIVAAYLMYAQQLDAQAALDMVVRARPCTQPNDGFLAQLDVFYQAAYKVERKNKAMRMYYLERALDEVMNGDGTLPSTKMFANFPRSPSDSVPPTPSSASAHPSASTSTTGPRRRIRCKLCRTELAAREHMLDHGQVGPDTPASALACSPAASRRPSTLERPWPGLAMSPRRGSAGAQATLNGEPVLLRRPSGSGLGPGSGTGSRRESAGTRPRRPSQLAPSTRAIPEGEHLDSSALADDDEDDDADEKGEEEGKGAQGKHAARTPSYLSPMDLAAQLNAHPKLAALRSPSGGLGGLQPMSPLNGPNSASGGSSNGSGGGTLARHLSAAARVPPLITNPACSGYFVEPMKWMEPALEAGELAGKIVCPNAKCGAKLGNYDWAGVCCSCRQWVTPVRFFLRRLSAMLEAELLPFFAVAGILHP
ncbi:hypothetical protein DFH11DRAFT_1626596 [Phellopilus nigrolimitatus]|nr:hypothetical protein DFH11DRAFT_1626596 [Phellopilus nigrolimitatus]